MWACATEFTAWFAASWRAWAILSCLFFIQGLMKLTFRHLFPLFGRSETNAGGDGITGFLFRVHSAGKFAAISSYIFGGRVSTASLDRVKKIQV